MSSDWRPPTLHTPRLVLRALTDADVEGIFAYASNPNVTRYTLFETHQDRDDSVAFLRDFAGPSYAEQMPGPLAICLKEEPKWLLGTLGCRWITRAHKTMELGYALAESHWGKGIAAEAARALLDHVFATYEVVRVQALCMIENLGSIRVMKKLGMTFEGRLRSAVFRRDRSWDMLIFSVLKCDWPTKGS